MVGVWRDNTLRPRAFLHMNCRMVKTVPRCPRRAEAIGGMDLGGDRHRIVDEESGFLTFLLDKNPNVGQPSR
jgi:hypothetical protein